MTLFENYLVDDKLAHGEGRFTLEVDETGNAISESGIFVGRFEDGTIEFAAEVQSPAPASRSHRWCPWKNSWGHQSPERRHRSQTQTITRAGSTSRASVNHLRNESLEPVSKRSATDNGRPVDAPRPAAPSSRYFGPVYTTSSRIRSGDSNIAE